MQTKLRVHLFQPTALAKLLTLMSAFPDLAYANRNVPRPSDR